MKLAWKSLGVTAAATLALAAPIAAHAGVVDVSGAFKDGSSVNGSVTIDVYGYVTDYSLTTSGGSLPGYTYTPSDSYFDNGAFYFDATPGYFGDLHLSFLDNLTTWSGPGPDPLTGASYECINSWSCGPGGLGVSATDVRFAVPEPASWALLMLGVSAVGAGLRFARNAQAPAHSFS